MTAPPILAAGAVVLAGVADGAVGELPTKLHPVAWFGRVVGALDRPWSRPQLVGSLAALVLPVVAAGCVAGVVAIGASSGRWIGGLLAGVALFVSLSRRMLLGEASAVVELSGEDVEAARTRLRSLAGRDASSLSPAELRSAAVESAAENLADGLVAPLLGFCLGATVSLPAAAGLAAWVKAVNTMDSMLGYHSTPTGWGPARLDDVVMFVPARTTAVLLALAAGRPGAVLSARKRAHLPSSPNSGWPMATAAAAVDCRLHKPGAYDLFPERALPDGRAGTRGVALVDRAAVLALLGAAGWCLLAGGGPWF
ncbi:MAG: CobD/CbiB family cobalamin biosynthesis protein [Halolamina sp.]